MSSYWSFLILLNRICISLEDFYASYRCARDSFLLSCDEGDTCKETKDARQDCWNCGDTDERESEKDERDASSNFEYHMLFLIFKIIPPSKES